jgi:trk system potassium uptake protein TrkA
MNIIIAGAGKVGFNLAKALCIGHNVTIIDKNSEALRRIQEGLDILPMRGDVENSKTYQNFIDKKVDLFIAVTNIDNVNLISTLMAESVLDIKRKFVRLQNHFFGDNVIKEKLQIDKMIFPIKLASKSIASLLDYPKANNIKFFKYTDYRLVSVRVSNNISSIQNFNIIGVERNKKFIIPFNEDVIQKDDLVYFFGLDEDIRVACSQLDTIDKSKIQKCVVFGGGKLAISISKELLKIGRDVKLVEKDLELCERADEELKGKASVINSKYGTIDLFEEEGLSSADFFIAATNNDEFNIIKCLEAQEKGINKVVAINNEMEYYNLMHSLGIIVARGPKMSAYNTIMEHIDSSGVVIQKSFCGAKAVVFMRKIFPNSKLINKKIKPPKVNNSNIFYIRENKFYPFDEKITLFENDLLIAFSNTQNSTKIKQWIYEL